MRWDAARPCTLSHTGLTPRPQCGSIRHGATLGCQGVLRHSHPCLKISGTPLETFSHPAQIPQHSLTSIPLARLSSSCLPNRACAWGNRSKRNVTTSNVPLGEKKAGPLAGGQSTWFYLVSILYDGCPSCPSIAELDRGGRSTLLDMTARQYPKPRQPERGGSTSGSLWFRARWWWGLRNRW